MYNNHQKLNGIVMNLILAVPNEATELKLKAVLQQNRHEIEAVCYKTHILMAYVEILRPDLVIMDLELPGKFKTTEITEYFNNKFAIPVVYLISRSGDPYIKEALETNPFGLITDPGDDRQVIFTLELAYKKFSECLHLL